MHNRDPKQTRGAPSFVELGVAHVGRARAFFEALLDWPIETMGPDAFFAQTSTAGIGLHGEDPSAAFTVYFTVEDLDGALHRVRELGGTHDAPHPADARFGRFADCRDDQGVRFGLRQLPPG